MASNTMVPMYVAVKDEKTGKETDIEAYQASNVDTSSGEYTFGKAGSVMVTLSQGFNDGKPLSMEYYDHTSGGSGLENLSEGNIVSSTRKNSEMHNKMDENCKKMNILNGVHPQTNLWNAEQAKRIEGLRRAAALEEERKAEQAQLWNEKNPEEKAAAEKLLREQQAKAREARLQRLMPKPTAALSVPVVPVSIVAKVAKVAKEPGQRIIIFKGSRYILSCTEADYMKDVSNGAEQLKGLRFHLEVKGKGIKIPSTHTLGYLANNTAIDDELVVVEDNSSASQEPSSQLLAFCKSLCL